MQKYHQGILWSIHILFWLLVLFYSPLVFSPHWGSFQDLLIANLWLLPAQIVAVYVTVWLILPYLFQRKYLFAFLSMLGLFCLNHLLSNFAMHKVNHFQGHYFEFWFFPFAKVLAHSSKVYLVVFLALALKLLQKFYQNQQVQQKLQQEKLKAELNLLKAQIHPHFLFNTLNNLYVLALKKSEKTPEAILTLSDLLHYILYDCKAESIALSKEITCLQNYINLEKLRYNKRLDLSFKISDYPQNLQIAPMLFLPLLENAFKHGTSDTLGNVWIKVTLAYDNHKLCFSVKNSRNIQNSTDQQNYREGIGLKNLKKRLEYLYNQDYQLEIAETKDSFEAKLFLKLMTNISI